MQWAVAPEGADLVAQMGFNWYAAGLVTRARREAAAAVLDEIMQLPIRERRGPLFAAFFALAAALVVQRESGRVPTRPSCR